MNWLDWLIIAVLAFSTIQGLRYGLVASVARLAGTLIGLGVAYTYYRPFAGYLSGQWNMEEKILPLVEKLLKLWSPTGNSVPPLLPPGKLTSAGSLAANPVNPVSDYLARMLASGVLEAMSFLVLLLVTAWVVNLAGRIFTKIADISFLGPLNHLGGFVFGAARGVVFVMIVLTLISPFQRTELLPGAVPNAPGSTLPAGNAFRDSKLLPYFQPLFNAINRPLPGVPTVNEPWARRSY